MSRTLVIGIVGMEAWLFASFAAADTPSFSFYDAACREK